MEPAAPELARFPRSVRKALLETLDAERANPKAWFVAVVTLAAAWYLFGREELAAAVRALAGGLVANLAWFFLVVLQRWWLQPERALSAARAAQNDYFRKRVSELDTALKDQTEATATLHRENLAQREVPRLAVAKTRLRESVAALQRVAQFPSGFADRIDPVIQTCIDDLRRIFGEYAVSEFQEALPSWDPMTVIGTNADGSEVPPRVVLQTRGLGEAIDWLLRKAEVTTETDLKLDYDGKHPV